LLCGVTGFPDKRIRNRHLVIQDTEKPSEMRLSTSIPSSPGARLGRISGGGEDECQRPDTRGGWRITESFQVHPNGRLLGSTSSLHLEYGIRQESQRRVRHGIAFAKGHEYVPSDDSTPSPCASRRNRMHSQFACRRSRPDRDRSA
jgi:hypothetical protein